MAKYLSSKARSKAQRGEKHRLAILDKIANRADGLQHAISLIRERSEFANASILEREDMAKKAISRKEERENQEKGYMKIVSPVAYECMSYSDLVERLSKHYELIGVERKQLKNFASKAWKARFSSKNKQEKRKRVEGGDAMSRAILTGFETNRRRH